MKIAIIFSVCLGMCCNSFAQYKVKGYVLREGLDTIWGTVAIPIVKEELDLASLYKTVSFSEGAGKVKKLRAKDIDGFGIIDDEITSDFITINKDNNPYFVRKLVEGYIDLFEIKIDASSGSAPIMKDAPSNKPYVSVYFFRKGADSLRTLQVDFESSYIIKKDLKKIAETIPDLYLNTANNISISDLAILIREYNRKPDHVSN